MAIVNVILWAGNPRSVMDVMGLLVGGLLFQVASRKSNGPATLWTTTRSGPSRYLISTMHSGRQRLQRL